MQVKNFQDLTTWKKAHNFVIEVYKTTKFFPEEEKFGITNQIRRSSSSICANISEGYRKSTKDFIRFLTIAQASLEETKYHLILSKDLQYYSISKFHNLYEKADEIGKMLNGLIKKLKAHLALTT